MSHDRHTDLLVLGSGAAGMTAALTASLLGLDVLLVEKAGIVGGTPARYVTRAATLAALAPAIGLAAKVLTDTVARHNGFAHTGVDEEFAKGSDAYQKNLGDARNRPNPCIGPIDKPPFFALAIHPSDIGTSCGLRTNEFGEVLRADGSPIAGLYACGNDMASIMAGAYPGPGINIGPGMTFGFIAARHAAADLGKSVWA